MRQALIALLREVAHEELLPRFRHGVAGREKADGSLVTEADKATQARLSTELQRRWPAISLLGEEMTAEQQQALLNSAADGLWLLDPLDGTSNFAAGIPFFCLSLALLRDGEVELGIILDPLRDEVFSAERGRGAWLNDEPLQVAPAPGRMEKCIALIDLKRLQRPLAARVSSGEAYRSQRNLGSGALDWCYLASGRVELYLHGGQKLWDYAAGELILREAGGHARTLEGEAVFSPSLAPRSVVAAVDGGLFRQWCDYLRGEG